MTNNKILNSFIFISFVFLFLFLFSEKCYADNVTIMIDPGHGGDNLGGQFQNFMEKEMTFQTALAMKEHLEKFEGVTVYLTHEDTTSKDVSLTNRAKLASEKNADFMFSLHYNKSLDNRLYGCEVWVSAFDSFYTRGMQFATIEMNELISKGLYNRGIKTRLNSKGTDYYGVIQHAREFQIPCVIIEHCHMDHENDIPYIQQEDYAQTFGILDAEAVAKYFRLKSSILGEDYSNYQIAEIAVPETVMKPDTTTPDTIHATLISTTDTMATIGLSGSDLESRIIYYDYSLDNGETFSPLMKWEMDEKECEFDVLLTTKEQQVICRIYNEYDLYCQSDSIILPCIKEEDVLSTEEAQKVPIESDEEASQIEEDSKQYVTVIKNELPQKNKSNTDNILLILLFVFIFIFTIVNLFLFFSLKKRKKHKRRRKK